MRKAAHAAVSARGVGEVEVGERVRVAGSGPHAEVLQQRLTDQMRRLPGRGADAEIDARLAEVDRQQLRVTIGEVQQAARCQTRGRP